VRSPRQTPSAPSSCRLFSISSGVALRLGLGTDFQPPPVFPLVCAPCLLQLKFGLALVDSFSARSFGRADQDSFADSTVQDFVFIFVRVVRLPIHICGQGFGCCWDFPFLPESSAPIGQFFLRVQGSASHLSLISGQFRAPESGSPFSRRSSSFFCQGPYFPYILRFRFCEGL
jgi:hypothetical protein